jgi:probable rRNA maturation factor
MTGRVRAAARARAFDVRLVVQFDVATAGLPRRATLARWVTAAAERDLAVTLRFVGAAEGRRLNARFRGHDRATNVLTFVYDDVVPPAGDLVLCVPVLEREARAQGKALRAHCAHLVIHGMLHLQGYDHERAADAARMEARETALLEALRYRDPYAAAAD